MGIIPDIEELAAEWSSDHFLIEEEDPDAPFGVISPTDEELWEMMSYPCANCGEREDYRTDYLEIHLIGKIPYNCECISSIPDEAIRLPLIKAMKSYVHDPHTKGLKWLYEAFPHLTTYDDFVHFVELKKEEASFVNDGDGYYKLEVDYFDYRLRKFFGLTPEIDFENVQ